ncbi:MAG TPA: hypothetical protein VFB53_06860 [Burkholderiales bacterium]|nr:hypothetical protein [Burkholderiales bacterium]
MREIQGVGEEAQLQRRWFHDEYFDLFVWQAPGGAVARFDLCYGAGASERALVWLGEGRFFQDGAPESTSDPRELLRRFAQAGAALPQRVRREVTARIQECAGLGPPLPGRRARFRRAPWQQRETSRQAGKGAARQA